MPHQLLAGLLEGPETRVQGQTKQKQSQHNKNLGKKQVTYTSKIQNTRIDTGTVQGRRKNKPQTKV